MNKIDHINYNPVMDMEEGQKYYRGVYSPNKSYFETAGAPLAGLVI